MATERATQVFERLFSAIAADDREAALAALRDGYELFNQHGVSAWLEVFDPEIEWSEGEEVPERHLYRGHEGVLRQQELFEEAWESFRIEPVDYVGSTDRIAVIVNLWGRGRESGVEVEAQAAHRWDLRDGKVVRFYVYGDPAKAIEAVHTG